jgi:alpha-tubulin suppressor-like RCC1 family protein
MWRRVVAALLALSFLAITETVEASRATSIGLAPVDRQTTRLVVGDTHSCVLLNNGVVKCWGDNTFGQLGVPTIFSSSTPVSVSSFGGGRHAIEIAAGKFHTCALLNDASVSCWGHNGFGSLGNGSTGSSYGPSNINVLQFKSISAGGFNTCGMTSSREFFCWGRNSHYQVSQSIVATVVSSPVSISLPVEAEVLDYLAVGENHSCGMTITNKLWCWGANADGQIGNGEVSTRSSFSETYALPIYTTVVSVSSGGKHTCLITNDNQIRCWGLNENGQLGDGTLNEDTTPRWIDDMSSTFIQLGAHHSCAIVSTGEIMCWGSNEEGELGNNLTTASSVPVKVHLPDGVTAKEIAAGLSHTCALLDSDEVMCWGNNESGKIGDGTTTNRLVPTKVNGLRTAPGSGSALASDISHNSAVLTASFSTTDVSSHRVLEYGTDETLDGITHSIELGHFGKIQHVAAGQHHSCVVITGGHVKCWGDNADGALGTGDTVSHSIPTDVVGLSARARLVAVGRSHSCAVLSNGTLQCWGDNSAGQLGDGTVLTRFVPTTADISEVVDVVLGDDFTCALQIKGVVSCWGSNDRLQFGAVGESSAIPVSVSVDNSHTVLGLSASSSRVCAVLSNGTVRCWGDGSVVSNPGTFNGPIGDVSVAQHHACAVLRDGSAQCWGSDSHGQLGDGSSDSSGNIVSVDFANGDSVVSVRSGENASCALLATGVVKCWGDGSTGLTAQTDSDSVHSPVAVQLLSNTSVLQISLATDHGCALGDQGQVKCWGNNSRIQQGIVQAFSGEPVEIPSLVDTTMSIAMVDLEEDTSYFYRVVTHSLGHTAYGSIDTFNTLEMPTLPPAEESPLVDSPDTNSPLLNPPALPDQKTGVPQTPVPATGNALSDTPKTHPAQSSGETALQSRKKKPSVKVGSLTAVSRVLRSLDYAVPKASSGKKMWMTVLDKRVCRVYNGRLWAIRKGTCQLMVLTMNQSRRLTMSRTQIRVVR